MRMGEKFYGLLADGKMDELRHGSDGVLEHCHCQHAGNRIRVRINANEENTNRIQNCARNALQHSQAPSIQSPLGATPFDRILLDHVAAHHLSASATTSARSSNSN